MILDIAIRNSSSLHTEVDNFDKNAITVYFFSDCTIVLLCKNFVFCKYLFIKDC